MNEQITSVFRGVDRDDAERQAVSEAARAAADGFRVANRQWRADGTPELTVRYERVTAGAGIDRPASSPWTAPRIVGLAVFLLVFVGWVLLSARP